MISSFKISCTDLKKYLENQHSSQELYILDVRTPEEFDEFSIEGSHNIPLQDLPNKINTLPKDKKIVVLCLKGIRSEKGCELLKNYGFENICSLENGLQELLE